MTIDTIPANKPLTLRQEIMAPGVTAQFKMALPSHIPVERFQRVTLTALNMNADLQNADRSSFFNACSKCAQDGLLPDGREAALVMFGGKVQYMPMVTGLIKLARNSGDLTAISAQVVYEADKFTYSLGDDEKLTHEPPPLGSDRGKPVGVYAIATLKSGERMREVMSVKDVEKVRNVSRAKNAGPWVQWWDEMARKTVIRRLSKRLPLSSELSEVLHRAIERDDDLTELADKARDITPGSAAASVDALLSQQDADQHPAPAVSDSPAIPSGAEPAQEVSPPTAGTTGAPADVTMTPVAWLEGVRAELAKAETLSDVAMIDAANVVKAGELGATTLRNYKTAVLQARTRIGGA